MPFSITCDIVRSNSPDSTYLLRSHLLHPHDSISIVFLLRAESENIASILEDHMLESISSTEWKTGEEESDFSFVTEKYNHFLKNIREEDVKGVQALFAVISKNHLIVSSIGKMCAILREADESLSIIHEADRKQYHFESFSSGEIPNNSAIFLTSEHLEDIFGEEFYDDASRLSSETIQETLRSTLKRESSPSIHIVRLLSKNQENVKNASSFRKKGQADIIRNTANDLLEKLHGSHFLSGFKRSLGSAIQRHHGAFLIAFLSIGVLLFFGLLSVLISSIFQVGTGGNNDLKNSLLEAKSLIEESQKLTSNPASFAASIGKAEKILTNLKEKNVYMKDTQDLVSRIEAMKKEMYDIQTIDLSKKKSLMAINPNDISPIGVFEFEKKLNLIGKNGAILDYAIGNSLTKVIPYPTGEEGISFTHTEDGSFFILSRDHRVLSSRKNNQIDYVSVMGQEGWEDALKIRSFNDNLYLVDTTKGEIYRHKPGVNGFAQKSEIGEKSFSGIIDIGVDGGFYILHAKNVERILSGKSYVFSGITLNKLPGSYQIENPENAELIVSKNLKYIYVRDGKRIWIFEPDSRQFQDIKAWNYVAQLDIATLEEVRNISVPRDGTLYVTTNLGVYDIVFDIVDNNIIIH